MSCQVCCLFGYGECECECVCVTCNGAVLPPLLCFLCAEDVAKNPAIPDKRPPWEQHKEELPNPRTVAAAVLLAWKHPISNGSQIEKYYIQARKGRGGPWRTVGVVPYVDTTWLVGLRPGTPYQFRMAARNGKGLSGVSDHSSLAVTKPNSTYSRWACLCVCWGGGGGGGACCSSHGVGLAFSRA